MSSKLRLSIEESPAVRLDPEGRVMRTPAIEKLLDEVRQLVARDALYTHDRIKIATALELVDDEERMILQKGA